MGEEEEGEEESVSGSERSEHSAGKTVKNCTATGICSAINLTHCFPPFQRM